MALATKTFALSTVPETGVGVQRGVSAGVRGTVLPPAPLRQHGVQGSIKGVCPEFRVSPQTPHLTMGSQGCSRILETLRVIGGGPPPSLQGFTALRSLDPPHTLASPLNPGGVLPRPRAGVRPGVDGVVPGAAGPVPPHGGLHGGRLVPVPPHAPLGAPAPALHPLPAGWCATSVQKCALARWASPPVSVYQCQLCIVVLLQCNLTRLPTHPMSFIAKKLPANQQG